MTPEQLKIVHEIVRCAGLENLGYDHIVQRNSKALSWIEEAIAAPVAQALPVAVEKLPTILFDGFAVLQALDAKAAKRTSAENVADTLDAVVRIMRRQGEKAS